MRSAFYAFRKWTGILSAASFAVFAGASHSALAQEVVTQKKDKLVGRAVLPAATFAEGPTSGTQIGNGPINGQPAPFVNKQPVQGFSAVLDNHDGTFLVMSDNGFGSLENSADYHLRVYTIKPSFETKKGGKGEIKVLDFFELHDPDKHISFTITNQFTDTRILTGADFDIESMQRAEDGTFWFGDEFGPFLIHTDANGKLLEAPIALPDFDNPGKEVRAPQNPYYEEASAVRLMNAVKRHAQIHGSVKKPVFAPWYVMINDADPATGSPDRQNPPMGLNAASSDIFNVSSLQNAGYPVVAWTVNDKPSMEALIKVGVNGIISDRPDLLWEVIQENHPEFLTSEGLIDITKFDAQGHRGGRNLRPENTLPAMEVALDYLMTTLELDNGITRDGVPVLDHDPYIEAEKVRRADGQSYESDDEALIKDLTLEEIQSTFIADKLLAGRPAQTNDRSMSPVSVAFAAHKGLIDPYVMPSLAQVFEFVEFYVNYYKTGAGSSHPDAGKRWKNAERVRFNVETKINPRTDADEKGNIFAERTVDFHAFAKAVADVIVAYNLQDRADIQSFGFQTLLYVQENYPQIRTVYLVGDFPKVGESGDGTNLQDQDGQNSPWLAGLYWPYRQTMLNYPFRAQGSGGFEGMALDHWHENPRLLPLLEKPLVGGEPNTLLIHEFDLASKTYTGVRYKYHLEPKGVAIGDFIMFSPERGVVIERDNSQGDLKGFKAIYEIELKGEGKSVGKRLAVDLMNIRDAKGISLPGLDGDVGLGEHFAFPFTTIEDVVVFDEKHIGVLNDNNYPFSIGRHVGAGLPDDNEFIIIKLEKALGTRKIEGVPGFTLVNAETGKDIRLIKGGETLQLQNLPSRQLSIRADFPNFDAKSVLFELNGDRNYRIENHEPYTLFGDDLTNGTYFGQKLAGTYSLVATPYSLPNGKGVAGKPIRAIFTVEFGNIVRFTWVNADTGEDIGPLTDGAIADLASLPAKKLSIRAEVDSENIGSVVFGLNDNSTFKIENLKPYALLGDYNEGKSYYGFTPPLQVHTLTAIPYAERGGKGAAGKPYVVTFEVIDSATESMAAAASSAAGVLYPNPVNDMINIRLGQLDGKATRISIVDAFGTEVYSLNRPVKKGEDLFQVNLANMGLKRGLYLLRIHSDVAEKTQVYRFFKN